jgi:hypothetical protein
MIANEVSGNPVEPGQYRLPLVAVAANTLDRLLKHLRREVFRHQSVPRPHPDIPEQGRVVVVVQPGPCGRIPVLQVLDDRGVFSARFTISQQLPLPGTNKTKRTPMPFRHGKRRYLKSAHPVAYTP